MTKDQYIKSILKGIKVTEKTKARIKYDLQTEIESKEEDGVTIDEIILQKGSPDEVANGFNIAYCDTAMRKQYCIQKFLKIAAIVLSSVSLLAFAGNTIIGTVLMRDISISTVGGADVPANIVVTEQPVSYFPNQFMTGNIIGCTVLIVGVICLITLIVVKKKNN